MQRGIFLSSFLKTAAKNLPHPSLHSSNSYFCYVLIPSGGRHWPQQTLEIPRILDSTTSFLDSFSFGLHGAQMCFLTASGATTGTERLVKCVGLSPSPPTCSVITMALHLLLYIFVIKKCLSNKIALKTSDLGSL